MGSKVALITAAGRGSTIGYSLARAYAAAGFDLVITARNKGRLKEAARDIEQEHCVRVLPVVLDVTSDAVEDEVAALVAQVKERFGRLDVLVNASQAAKVGDPLQRCKLPDLELSLKSGLVASFLLMKACHPLLKASKGTVINLVSAGSTAAQPGLSMLAASKEGLRGMSAVAAREWAEDGIAVHCVEPVVATAAYEKWASEYPEVASELSEPEPLSAFAERCVSLALER